MEVCTKVWLSWQKVLRMCIGSCTGRWIDVINLKHCIKQNDHADDEVSSQWTVPLYPVFLISSVNPAAVFIDVVCERVNNWTFPVIVIKDVINLGDGSVSTVCVWVAVSGRSAVVASVLNLVNQHACVFNWFLFN